MIYTFFTWIKDCILVVSDLFKDLLDYVGLPVGSFIAIICFFVFLLRFATSVMNGFLSDSADDLNTLKVKNQGAKVARENKARAEERRWARYARDNRLGKYRK